MAVEWVGAKPGVFINNSVVTPIDQNNLNSIVNTIDKIATGGSGTGLTAEFLDGKSKEDFIVPSEESLVVYYSFDDVKSVASQQIEDDSGLKNYATLYNVTPIKGVVGTASSFNGTSSYGVGVYPNLNATTISMWVKTTATNGPLLLLKKATNATRLGLYINSGSVKCIFTDADNVVQEVLGCVINDGLYHHVVMTHSGTKCSVYCDGELVSSVFQTLTDTYYNELVLCSNEAHDSFTPAILDNVKVYSTALTDGDIYALYMSKTSVKVKTILTPFEAEEFAKTVKNSGNETIAGVKTFSDGVVSKTLQSTDDTYRVSSSFTLPAMPDGARKRILNTHATNAITVTANSGTTIEGQATMTLSAGHEVELELIGTDWQKTGWNEKSLASFVGPVDCSSRVAEYTGDGGGATVKDRAGNGNNLTATDITYVNGKFGKEMSFNGSTSYAQASNPVIGTTGTVAVRFKRGAIGTKQDLLATSNAVSNGLIFYFSPSNVLRLVYSNGTSLVGSGTKVFGSTNIYSSVVVNSSGQVFYDGVLSTDTVPTTWVLGLLNLLLGSSATSFFNGIISHFRYDSRIWTADEARAWSLNPISIDSRV